MRAVDIILKKRDNLELSKEEIHFIIDGYVKGTIPDYQISALLMAICFNGLSNDERVNLTYEMLNSGEQIDLSSIDGICVDKHSTGGVGDKTTLVIGPILSACGLKLAKMSGRGLGHTGGTLDKLESIPGLTVSVSPEDFLKQVTEIGIAVVGQTANITPADKKLYALRDVTGTVESVGLIASSIMSKKLASGAKHILLDVKVGDGAFMKDLESARILARAMVDIGNSCGRKTVAMITDMDEPLGEAVGNSIEVIEAIETLKGNGPTKFTELCYELSATLLQMAGVCESKDDAISMVEEVLSSGKALEQLKLLIKYQGGNPGVIDDYGLFPKCSKVIEIKAPNSGYVSKIKTEQIGVAAMLLGAGRMTKDDNVDLAVGLKILKHVGDYVLKDDIIALAYVNEKGAESVTDEVLKAYSFTADEISKNKIILDKVE